MKTVRRICLSVLFCMVVYAAWTGYSVWSFSYTNETVQTDAAVVLGAAVYDGKPSPVFTKRIDHALWLKTQGYVDKLIFTGGKGEGSNTAESEAAAAYAVKKGIAEEDIFTESTSQITEENLSNAKKIAGEHNIETMTLVSDPLHMKRAAAIADHLHMNVVSSPTQDSAYQSLRTKIPFFLREWVFYTGYQLLRPFR